MKPTNALLLALVFVIGLAVPVAAHQKGEFEVTGSLSLHSVNDRIAYVRDDDKEVEELFVGPGNGWYVSGRYWFTERFAGGIAIDHLSAAQTQKRFDNDEFRSESDVQTLDASVRGYLATGSYLLVSHDHWHVELQGGVGSYNISRTVHAEYVGREYNADGDLIDGLRQSGDHADTVKPATGFLLAGQLSADMTDKISLVAHVGYRSLSTTIESRSSTYEQEYYDEVTESWVPMTPSIDVRSFKSSEYNFSSWSAGAGIVYHF